MSELLDRRYGPLWGPKPEPWRLKGYDEWESAPPSTLTVLGSGGEQQLAKLTELVPEENNPIFPVLNQLCVLWVCDSEGRIMIALEEVFRSSGVGAAVPRLRRPDGEPSVKKLGHPSLVNCCPARIGGEIIYSPSEDNPTGWEINNESGRYGRRPEQKAHLNFIKKEFERYGFKNLFERIYPVSR